MQLMEVVEKQRQYYKSVRDFQEVCQILTLCLWFFPFTLLIFLFIVYLFLVVFLGKKAYSCYCNGWLLLLLIYFLLYLYDYAYYLP